MKMSIFISSSLFRRRGQKWLKIICVLTFVAFFLFFFGVNRTKVISFNEKYELKSLQDIQNKIFAQPVSIFENLGEFAVPVEMPNNLPPDIQNLVDEGWRNHSFNMYLSDLISVQRKLPDFRSEYCKTLSSVAQLYSYRKNLPSTSVIIVFHNEGWSTLLRSVHSVLNRSPESLIAEVILVDDASTFGELVCYENSHHIFSTKPFTL